MSARFLSTEQAQFSAWETRQPSFSSATESSHCTFLVLRSCAQPVGPLQGTSWNVLSGAHASEVCVSTHVACPGWHEAPTFGLQLACEMKAAMATTAETMDRRRKRDDMECLRAGFPERGVGYFA